MLCGCSVGGRGLEFPQEKTIQRRWNVCGFWLKLIFGWFTQFVFSMDINLHEDTQNNCHLINRSIILFIYSVNIFFYNIFPKNYNNKIQDNVFCN